MSFLDKIISLVPFPIGKKEAEFEYYFALNIGLSEVSAGVWGISANVLDLFGQASLKYSGSDDLVEKSYQVLDKALGALEIEPQKILFGTPESWAADDNLKEPYLKLLRRMVKEFGLEPMAYVTTAHAISHLLSKQESSPQTAILLGVGDYLEATLLKGGKIIESRTAKRSERLFEDIEKVLLQFSEVEVLPSKILLYITSPAEQPEKRRNELMGFPWMAKLPFLHFPRIEVLPKDIAVAALALAGASEIDEALNLKKSLTNILAGEALLPTAKSPLIKHNLKEEVGFVRGDISKTVTTDDPLISPDMVEEEPRRRLTRIKPEEELATGEPELGGDDEESFFAPPQEIGKELIPASVASKLQEVIPFDIKLPKLGRILKLPHAFKGPVIFPPVFLLILFAAYLLLFKATVTVYIEPKNLEKDAQIIADPSITSVDSDKKIIPGTVVETTVSGSDKATASGTKQIGDPAKGQIIIYNKTDSSKNFPSGTIFSGANNLKFALDSAVNVASESAVEGGISFGKSSGSITAAAIGPDSNLPGGTELSINGLAVSSYSAKVDQALSGGTSKNVTVVTADDQKKLQAKVLDALRQKAQDDLKTKLQGDKKIIPEALSVVDGKYNFSKQVNDQAGEFALSATVHFKGTAYSDTDLRSIVAKLVETNVPDGFEINLNEAQTQADVVKVEKDGKLVFLAKFEAKLQPKLDSAELKNKIKGKSVAAAIEQLKTVENVVGADVAFSPPLLSSVARLPFLSKNITIIVTPK